MISGGTRGTLRDGWQPMDCAPKDNPILAWCRSECRDPLCAYGEPIAPDCRHLCLYHGHAEGMGAFGDGLCIIEWGGSWDDSTWESPNSGWMPDWWFRAGSEFEEAANPVFWMPLPAPPAEEAE